MSFHYIDILGYIGGSILAICNIPQIIQMWATRSADDISYISLCFYILGLILMITYLIGINALAGWVAMILEVVLCVAVIILKYLLSFDSFKLKTVQDGDNCPIEVEDVKENHSHDYDPSNVNLSLVEFKSDQT